MIKKGKINQCFKSNRGIVIKFKRETETERFFVICHTVNK